MPAAKPAAFAATIQPAATPASDHAAPAVGAAVVAARQRRARLPVVPRSTLAAQRRAFAAAARATTAESLVQLRLRGRCTWASRTRRRTCGPAPHRCAACSTDADDKARLVRALRRAKTRVGVDAATAAMAAASPSRQPAHCDPGAAQRSMATRMATRQHQRWRRHRQRSERHSAVRCDGRCEAAHTHTRFLACVRATNPARSLRRLASARTTDNCRGGGRGTEVGEALPLRGPAAAAKVRQRCRRALSGRH